jgi:DNA-directed RNA polymerase subunit RPC12/RpoP
VTAERTGTSFVYGLLERVDEADHLRRVVTRQLAARTGDCGEVEHLRRVALHDELRSPAPPWVRDSYENGGYPDGCSGCGNRATWWEGRTLPSGRRQMRCTGCGSTITMGEPHPDWDPRDLRAQASLDDYACPLDLLPLTEGVDYDGDENGVRCLTSFSCPLGHHYPGEYSGPDEYRPLWEGAPS